jgi:molybdate transport repressor ModE-like protein
MDVLEALRFFGHVARCGSISAAARVKGLSTTAASKKLQDLETEFGVRLVDRTTRSLALTEAGQRLLAGSNVLLNQLDETLASVRELQATPSGLLRILSRRWFALHEVTPILPAFRNAYPAITIELELSDEVDITPRNGIDLAITLGNSDDKSIIAHQLTTDERRVCGSPGYFERAGVPREPADLAHHDCLTYRRASEPAVWMFEDKRRLLPVKVKGPVQSNNGDILRQAAIDGLGLMFLPEHMAARDVAAGRLTTCLDRFRGYQHPYRQPVYLLHRRGQLPAKCEAFISFLLDHLSGRPGFSRRSGR